MGPALASLLNYSVLQENETHIRMKCVMKPTLFGPKGRRNRKGDFWHVHQNKDDDKRAMGCTVVQGPWTMLVQE